MSYTYPKSHLSTNFQHQGYIQHDNIIVCYSILVLNQKYNKSQTNDISSNQNIIYTQIIYNTLCFFMPHIYPNMHIFTILSTSGFIYNMIIL